VLHLADLAFTGAQDLARLRGLLAAASEHFKHARLTTVDVPPLGSDAAREIGTYFAAPRAAGGVPLSGKYVFIWRKVGDDSRLHGFRAARARSRVG
jgi:hypothetical protein